jgi:hypothetical protein
MYNNFPVLVLPRRKKWILMGPVWIPGSTGIRLVTPWVLNSISGAAIQFQIIVEIPEFYSKSVTKVPFVTKKYFECWMPEIEKYELSILIMIRRMLNSYKKFNIRSSRNIDLLEPLINTLDLSFISEQVA